MPRPCLLLLWDFVATSLSAFRSSSLNSSSHIRSYFDDVAADVTAGVVAAEVDAELAPGVDAWVGVVDMANRLRLHWWGAYVGGQVFERRSLQRASQDWWAWWMRDKGKLSGGGVQRSPSASPVTGREWML